MERYHIVSGVGVYYVTFTVVEWLPVFIDEHACKIITGSFILYQKQISEGQRLRDHANAYACDPV